MLTHRYELVWSSRKTHKRAGREPIFSRKVQLSNITPLGEGRNIFRYKVHHSTGCGCLFRALWVLLLFCSDNLLITRHLAYDCFILSLLHRLWLQERLLVLLFLFSFFGSI